MVCGSTTSRESLNLVSEDRIQPFDYHSLRELLHLIYKEASLSCQSFTEDQFFVLLNFFLNYFKITYYFYYFLIFVKKNNMHNDQI